MQNSDGKAIAWIEMVHVNVIVFGIKLFPPHHDGLILYSIKIHHIHFKTFSGDT